jgi:hypothetical protein
MRGKQVPDFSAAYRALYVEGFGMVLIPSDDEMFPGFQVIIRHDQLNDAALPRGFFQTAPQSFTRTFGFPAKPKCYATEQQDAPSVLTTLATMGYDIEFNWEA